MSSPAPSGAVESLRSAFPFLPSDYLSFLAQSNGAEGPLGVEPGWFVLWPAEEVFSASAEYGLPQYLPGYFAFGGNGGGELFVFPSQPSDSALPIFMVPAIGMEPSMLIKVAGSFAEFATAFGEQLASHA